MNLYLVALKPDRSQVLQLYRSYRGFAKNTSDPEFRRSLEENHYFLYHYKCKLLRKRVL